MTVVSVEAVCKRYGDKAVVSNLTFSLQQGEVLGLLGENGAGKTTTLRMLTGLIRPDEGQVRLFNRPIPGDYPSVMARVGALIEQPGLYPHLSGADNVRVAAYQSGHRVNAEDIADRLRQVGLDDAAHQRARSYSSGMKTRLGIACALIGDPELLILDEPTSGLDPSARKVLRMAFTRLADYGKTIIMASHELTDVEQVCDRVVLMQRGESVLAGSMADVIGQRQGVWVLVAHAHASDILARLGPVSPGRDGWLLVGNATTGDVLKALAEAEIFPDDIQPAIPSLEDVFLSQSQQRPRAADA